MFHYFLKLSISHKMITQHKLLIDQHCPLCRIYGKGFVACRLVDSDTLLPYQAAKPDTLGEVDMQRATSEIALVGPDATHYGIDALLHILTHQRPTLSKLAHWPPLYFLLRQLYAFISYNRKVIAPVDYRIGDTCQPALNRRYRIAYVIAVAIATALVLNIFTAQLLAHFGVPHYPYMEWIICFGQVAWQAVAIRQISPKHTWDYLGNMSTVSLIGGLLVALFLLAAPWINGGWMVHMAAFMLIVGIMLVEHIRRCRLLGVDLRMTVSWVAFRLCFLLIILTIYFA